MNLNCNGSLMGLFAEINKFRLLVEKAFNKLLKSFKLASIVKLYAITNKLLRKTVLLANFEYGNSFV